MVLSLTAASYYLVRGIYRRCLHPLAPFPGPLQASMTENWLYSQSLTSYPEEQFERLHSEYNTRALRIGPNELHITDHSLYATIYNHSAPFPKYAAFYDAFLMPHTLFTEYDPARHRQRRRMLKPFFSRSGVSSLEPVITEKARILGAKINRICDSTVINVYDAFRALTAEVILQFAFGRPGGLIDERPSGFGSAFVDGLDVMGHGLPVLIYRPWLRAAIKLIPPGLMGAVFPEHAQFMNVEKLADESVRFWQSDTAKPAHPIMFDLLSEIADESKHLEATGLLVAGSGTTASVLTTAVIQILHSSGVHTKLLGALEAAYSTAGRSEFIPLAELEKCDYLIACIKEALRLGMPIPGRLPRVVPSRTRANPLIVDGKLLPPGTIVSISAYTMHTNPEIWGADVLSYNPERWLTPSAKDLDQYLVSFSKGSRSCIAQSLAIAEITIVLAFVFRNYELSLPPDFKVPGKVDRFTLQYAGGSPGIPVRFRRRLVG
ncbi:cytochrome P450 [Aspergillus pseudoustus]|uniref:Cytochrome P450 n=1 Tax=Aspergillus pseudoustus TaxID=1810923 RepID=A0ABR4IXI5_9EURO